MRNHPRLIQKGVRTKNNTNDGYPVIFPSLRLSLVQGGILFWLRGNLRDRPGISPEIALIKNKNNDRKCI